jgi:beta-N-acetylhexosaminidase
LGCALIKGLQGADGRSVAACGKHFPGHGDTTVDSHFDLPRLDHDLERLNQVELQPFAAAVKVGVAAIMTSHVLFESLDARLPATMSEAIIDGILRRHLSFDGVVISDDLEMHAIADHFGIEQAVTSGSQAGVDLFMVCHQAERQHQAIDALIRAGRNGQAARTRIEQSNRRLDTLFERFVR